MVRLAPDDRTRPIELLRQHEPREIVGQRPWCECQAVGRSITDIRPQAECAADENRDITRSLPLILHPAREMLGCHGLPHDLAGDDASAVWNRAQESFPFPFANEVRGAGSTRLFTDLVHFERPVAGRTRFILADRGSQMRVARLAHDSHDESQAYIPRSRCTVATRLIDSMYAAVRMFTLCCFDSCSTAPKLFIMMSVRRSLTVSSVQK